MTTQRAFTVSVSDERVAELKSKLEHASFPQEISDPDWTTGAPLSDVKRLVKYWTNSFDWRKVEREINKLPNYETRIEVDGFNPVDVHFVHYKSEINSAIPIILVHGWPGSFFEYTKVLPLLRESETNGGPAFHIVVPSLPNHGFSSLVGKPSFGLKQFAETCHKLMLSLGYEQYVSQGGDWGSMITRTMAMLYPASIKACHLNFITPAPPSPKSPLSFVVFLIRYMFSLLPPAELRGLAKAEEFQKTGNGYLQIQSTRPQSIGYLLADSPAGLMGWIYEKLHVWTDDYKWTDEEVCTWVSIYWFSRAGPAANVRTYYEAERGQITSRSVSYAPGVKFGLSHFPKEVLRLPSSWGSSTLGEVVFETEHKSGGHFAAWECPQSLVGDLRIMFGQGGGAYGVVEGKLGYA